MALRWEEGVCVHAYRITYNGMDRACARLARPGLRGCYILEPIHMYIERKTTCIAIRSHKITGPTRIRAPHCANAPRGHEATSELRGVMDANSSM